jgi:transposase-like protein
MIDKDELLNNKDFYKSFKNADDLTSFFKTMHKRAVEHMLDAELDAHLDNEKHDKTASGNYRKGHGTKKIKTSFGENEIKVPRDRDSSFNPILVPKRGKIAQGIENVIISLYAKGMSVSDIEEQIKEVYMILKSPLQQYHE